MQVSVSQAAQRAEEFFMGQSAVHQALRRIATELQELGIPFAVAGAMALNAHGYQRMTVDVDILLRPEGLQAFKNRWLGRGWMETFPGSKGLRDVVLNVKVDVLLTGDYPGDGKPKPVAFPDPAEAGQAGPGEIPYLTLEKLVELKLASGMTAPHRLKDLADVLELIRLRSLPEDFAERLDPFVQAKYRELWPSAQVVEDY